MASETHEATDQAAGAAHGGAEAVGMPQLDVTTFGNQIFWLLVTLVVIYFVLSRIALPRIASVLAERQGTITNDLASAEDLKAKAEKAEEAYNKALADARSEAQEIVNQTKAEIKADLDDATAKADAEIAAKAAEGEIDKPVQLSNTAVEPSAAIVVLGIRAFFLQPFIIPTNSMYPTYSGMYHQVYDAQERPSLLAKPFRFLLLGARNREVVAESDGPVRIPLFFSEGRGDEIRARAMFEVVDGRKWLVVPTKLKRYPIIVGDQATGFEVPLDFDADSVLLDRFFPEAESWGEVIARERTSGRFRREGPNRGMIEVPNARFKEGETVLNFDVLSGDALFVDRFTYHFFPPKVGDPIVFRTGTIDYPPQPLGEKYYIKRLAGTGGDTLEIRPPALFINGEIADQVSAFTDNAEEIDGYRGYVNDEGNLRYLTPGSSYTIPEEHFFALGDNSHNSLDSRYWGSFDQKAVIGRALFIYYPFTKRWGLAE